MRYRESRFYNLCFGVALACLLSFDLGPFFNVYGGNNGLNLPASLWARCKSFTAKLFDKTSGAILSQVQFSQLAKEFNKIKYESHKDTGFKRGEFFQDSYVWKMHNLFLKVHDFEKSANLQNSPAILELKKEISNELVEKYKKYGSSAYLSFKSLDLLDLYLKAGTDLINNKDIVRVKLGPEPPVISLSDFERMDENNQFLQKTLGNQWILKFPPNRQSSILHRWELFQKSGGKIGAAPRGSVYLAMFTYNKAGYPTIHLNTSVMSVESAISLGHELDHFVRSERWIRRIERFDKSQSLSQLRIKYPQGHVGVLDYLELQAAALDKEHVEYVLEREKILAEEIGPENPFSEFKKRIKSEGLHATFAALESYPKIETIARLILHPPKGVDQSILNYRQNLLMDSMIDPLLESAQPLSYPLDYRTIKQIFETHFGRFRVKGTTDPKEIGKLSAAEVGYLESLFYARLFLHEFHQLDKHMQELGREHFLKRTRQ